MIVCANCGQYLKTSKIGVFVAMKSAGRTHSVYSADLKECPGCKAGMLTDFGGAPVKEAHQDGFDKLADLVEFVVEDR